MAYFMSELLAWKTQVLVSIALTLFIVKIIQDLFYNKRLPPGPWGIPWFGRLPWMYKIPHEQLLSFTEKYGDIVSVRLGNQLMIYVSSPKLIRDIFKRSDFTARPNTPLSNLMGGYGVVYCQGPLWVAQRQFIFEKLRSLGMTLNRDSSLLLNIINNEVKELLIMLERRQGESIDPNHVMSRYVHNIICQIMGSFRFTEDDTRFDDFNKLVSEGIRLYGQLHIGEFVPAYLMLPGKGVVMDALRENHRITCAFHSDILRKRKLERIRDGINREPVDLLDYYLQEIENAQEMGNNSPIFAGVSEDDQIVQVMNDLFSAGMETVRTALSWTLVMMVREPECALRVRNELKNVVPPGSFVNITYRPYLQYCEAAIFETIRRVSVVPTSLPHVNVMDWNINGFLIPAGSQVLALINKLNMDPVSFPEPEKFRPERFLDGNGQIVWPEYFMPFGVGRRMCLGDTMARMELFLFFTNIMNNFDFWLPEGEQMPSLHGAGGTVHVPNTYNLTFMKR